ncbi:MFS transporter [Egicoccus sp. AB-alg2]|uniref:MFS transporter n=1 Tax=Egicoccus sp. AB-alg2 TaxID=3242693 RepID=UPI00359D65E9
MTAPATASVGQRAGFGQLWLGAGASNLADGILFAGLPVLALQVTDSPALVAGVAVALQLPMALTALPAGVLADRVDRRHLLVAFNVLRVVGLLAATVAVVLGELHLALVYAVAALAGGSEIVVDTTAQTAVPMLVPREDLGRANARLGGTQVVMNDAVGAPVGSFLAGAGAALVLGGPALLFALAAALVARLRLRAAATPEPHARGQLRRDLRDGVGYLGRHVVLRRLAIVAGIVNFGNMAFFAVFPVFVVGPLGLPAQAYGWFLAAVALGGVLGSLVADRLLRRVGLSRLLRRTSVFVAGVVATIALVADPAVTAVGVMLLGATGMTWNVGVRVLRQQLVPASLLGRVTATSAFVALIAAPLGGLTGGLVAEAYGVRWPALLATTCVLLGRLLLRPVDAAAIEQATAAADGADETVAAVSAPREDRPARD